MSARARRWGARWGVLALVLLGAALSGEAAGRAQEKGTGQEREQGQEQEQEQQQQQDPPREPAPRPRVLLLCDQSFQNHASNAAKALQEGCEVVRSPLGFLSTGAALERLDEVLGEQSWDLVCFNFGLGDLMCRDPRTRRLRAMSPRAGGVPVTGIEEYGAQLEFLVQRFRARGARLVWLSTMPVHPNSRSSAIVPEAIAAYNQRAAEVLRRRSVAVVDTHGQVQSTLDEVENPRNVNRVHGDLFKTDLSGPLVAAIRERLADGD